MNQGISLVILSRKILAVSHSLYLNWVTEPRIHTVSWKPSFSSAPEAQGKKKEDELHKLLQEQGSHNWLLDKKCWRLNDVAGVCPTLRGSWCRLLLRYKVEFEPGTIPFKQTVQFLHGVQLYQPLRVAEMRNLKLAWTKKKFRLMSIPIPLLLDKAIGLT